MLHCLKVVLLQKSILYLVSSNYFIGLWTNGDEWMNGKQQRRDRRITRRGNQKRISPA